MRSDAVSSPDGVVNVEIAHEDCSSRLGSGIEGFDNADRDVQAIYFSSTRQDDLIRAIGRIPRNGQAPARLTEARDR